MDWLIGRNPVMEALRGERQANQLLLADGVKLPRIEHLAREARLPIKRVPRSKLDGISEGRPHQGVALQVAAFDYVDLWETIQGNDAPLLLLLDGIEDPHNLGAILRSADAFGVDCVVIPKRRACGLTQAVARTSAGAIEHVPVARVTNIADTVRRLKKEGVWIWGSDADGKGPPRNFDLERPMALIISSEGKGIGPQLRKLCDGIFSLPMQGKVNSLNASVAAGILLYDLTL